MNLRAFVLSLALLMVLPGISIAATPAPALAIPSLPAPAPAAATSPLLVPAEVPAPEDLSTAPGFGAPVAMPGGGRGEPGVKVDRVHNDIWVHSFESSWSSINGGPFQADGPLVPLSGDGEIALGDPLGEFPHRVYKMDLTVACESMAWKDLDLPDTDPLGLGTWLRDDADCGIPIQDRQWLATGPNVLTNGQLAPSPLGTPHQEAVYLAVNQLATGLFVAKAVPSLTGTVPHFVQAIPMAGGCWRGNIAVDQIDGTVYVADCNGFGAGVQQVFRSTTGGVSWQAFGIPGSGASILFPVVAVDNAHNVYMVWTSASTYDVMFSYSTNRGVNWSPPMKVNNVGGLGPEGTVFPWITAGDDGKVDIVYLGTQRNISGNQACPNVAGGTCLNTPPGVTDLYYLYMAQSLNAHDATPVFTETQVLADPVQRGNICTNGTGCPGGAIASGPPRHLADFIQVDYDADGYAVIAFADGCPAPCAPTGPISGSATTTVVRQTSGPSILGATPPPSTPAVFIDTPDDGDTVAPGDLTVSGTVNRFFTGAPTATLSASPASGAPPLAVTFSLGASDDGTIASYSLDYDDGSTPLSGSGAPPATAAHTYAAAGTYDAVLSVTDGDGNTGTATATVSVAATGRVLWLVGDGTTTVVTDVPPLVQPDKSFELSPASNGGQETRYTTVGSWNMDAPGNAFVPTFVLDGPVTLTGETVHLLVDVDYAFPLNGEVLTCPLAAQILTKDGSAVLGPAGGASAAVATDLPGTFHRIDFAIDPAPGSYDGLMVQFGTTGVDCGSTPATWAWGSADHNGRLVLGASDSGGGPGPISLSLAKPSVPAQDLPGLSLFPLSAEPIDDGTVPMVWGEIGDITVSNNNEDLTIRLDLAGLLDGAVPTVLGNPFTYQVAFTADHNFAAGLEYRVTYTFDLVQTDGIVPTGGLLTDTFDLLVATAPNAGGLSTLCQVTTDLSDSFFDLDTGDAVWVIPLSAFNQNNQPPQGSCAFTTGGRSLQGGDVLQDVAGEAATKVATITIGGLGDTTDPFDYTLSGGAPPLVASAGGPYSGATGVAVSISGSATGGTPPHSCAWSGSGATFADASACSTTVTYASAGSHSITLTVTDSASVVDTDTATVTVFDPERVEVELVGTGVEATDLVSTSSSSPTDSWSVTLDLSGVADGTYTLTATWIDADGTTLDTDSIEITVDSPSGNSAPTISAPGNQTTDEGSGVGFWVSASDPDGDPVRLEAWTLPSGARFYGGGFFNWTPDYTQSGVHAATFKASDGRGGEAFRTVYILVGNVNQAPVLADLSDLMVSARDTLRFTVSATDADGDAIYYLASPLPEGATLDNHTGEFSWTPEKKQTGAYALEFFATDGQGGVDVEPVTVTVVKK